MYEELFYKRLVELRLNKGVSARDMSLSIGQSAGYINALEKNKVPSALSTPLPLTHEGFWGFPLSLFVVKYSYV